VDNRFKIGEASSWILGGEDTLLHPRMCSKIEMYFSCAVCRRDLLPQEECLFDIDEPHDKICLGCAVKITNTINLERPKKVQDATATKTHSQT